MVDKGFPMHSILAQLVALATFLVSKFGYIGIWAGMTIESAAVPLPSEAIMGLAGFFVHLGTLNLFLAALAGAIGNATGSTIMYYIGYKGGKPLVLKYGKKFGITTHEFEKGEKWITKYGDGAIFVSQLLPVVRTYVSLPPGVLKMNFKKFIFFTFTGAYVWCLALAFMAMKLGEHWEDLTKYMKGFQYVVIAALAIGVLVFVIKHWKTLTGWFPTVKK